MVGIEAVGDVAKQLKAGADAKEELTGRLSQSEPILVAPARPKGGNDEGQEGQVEGRTDGKVPNVH